MDPKRLLIDAVSNNYHTGSSTCVIACLDQDKPELKAVNLGDSGYMILRKNGLDLIKLFRTKEQQHQFNFPYQVGTGGDDPAKGDEFTHEVQHNDIVVMATDGLFDNLFDVKIIELMRPFIRERDEILDH